MGRPPARRARTSGIVGRSVPRKEGADKVTGAAKYVDDRSFPGMLHGRTIRSSIPCGAIVSIRLDFDPSGFVIVDHRDIPGRNVVALIDDDQPSLATGQIRHAEEPILLLAHEDPEQLLGAQVHIEYRQADPVFDPALSPVTFKSLEITKGDLGAGFARATHIVDGEYRTGHQEQLYIEPNGMIAMPDEHGGIVVYGSLQCPYYVHRALKVLLGLPDERVRVVQVETGGGFGGKEEYPSMIAGHAALLARKAGRPVKLVYDRLEDMVATTKRHPAVVRHRTGVTRDGRLTAMDIDVLMDGGAYATLSAVVLSRGAIHATGPYRCDDVRVRGRAVMTNTPPNGAFRGFGAPQTQFAVEVHMERIAEALGMDPVVLRERNALRRGDTTATGQRLHDCSALAVLREAVRRTDFRRRRRAARRTSRGLGLSLFFHGSGFTGSGEVKLASKASLELTDRGARIRVASAEIGQGSRTIHAQIVAETLGIPFDAVEVAEADTSLVPDSGPTVASRTSMVVGGLLERCARDLRARLGRLTPGQYLRRHGPLVITKEYERPKGPAWDDATYRGDAYGTYAWACNVAEIELDPDTYQVRPLKITAVQEVGRVLHPVLAAGQIEGGTAQGVGFGLIEEVVLRDGRMANAQLTNYIMPTTLDTPDMEVVMLERPYRHGPFGAKGIGELPIDGPAPALVNAIRSLGLDVRDIPATPERIFVASGAARR
jgi:CO/xanthine dehydrogenase Mo-binding subunit